MVREQAADVEGCRRQGLQVAPHALRRTRCATVSLGPGLLPTATTARVIDRNHRPPGARYFTEPRARRAIVRNPKHVGLAPGPKGAARQCCPVSPRRDSDRRSLSPCHERPPLGQPHELVTTVLDHLVLVCHHPHDRYGVGGSRLVWLRSIGVVHFRPPALHRLHAPGQRVATHCRRFGVCRARRGSAGATSRGNLAT